MAEGPPHDVKFISLLAEPKPNYVRIWEMQRELLEKIREGSHPETVLLCEHEPVLTCGRRTKKENILSHDLPVYDIERGGDVTLHMPGQLVIYPLIRFKGGTFLGGLHSYLRFLEDCVRDLVSSFRGDLEFDRTRPTGLWIQSSDGPRKIASIGIAVRHWITYHGIAINVSNALDLFSSIRPCDFEANVMTSLAQWTPQTPDLARVASRFESIFRDRLKHQC